MHIWGLDLGVTSIGWAVVDLDEARQAGRVVKLGARIFPEARDPKHVPYNQERRAKRMARRQLRRRRERRKALNEALAEAGLLPPFQSADWPKAMAVDPYVARADGLARRIEPWELGRAIYHLAKRRHFKGRDVVEDGKAEEESSDEKAAEGSREGTVAALKASGLTMGQWLATKGPHEKKRGHHAKRDVVREELAKLVAAQARHHPALRDPAFRSRIEEIIFHQRPVFWRPATLGECPLMPGEALCAKGSWLSQQRRTLDKVNSLRIAGGNQRPLDEEERAAILAGLATQQSMSWGGVRKALAAIHKARGGSSRNLKFNLEDSSSGLKGNLVELKLREVLGAAWETHPHRQALREGLFDRLFAADYRRIGDQRIVILPEAERRRNRAEAARAFAADFGLAAAEAEALAAIELPAGWGPYSTAALRKILPRLEAGDPFGKILNSTDPEWQDWRDAAFPDRVRPTGELVDRLPSPKDKEEQRRLGKLRNPTVVRTLNELRKVVNNLIDVYGKPDLIRIELARELSQSKTERERTRKGQNDFERERKKAKADLIANGIAEPSRDDVEKWLLWHESSKRCPYTGDHIGFDELFRTGRFQVEHIWPRKRSPVQANRIGNKTLCREDVNREKNDRTPYEAFGHQPERWAEIVGRLSELGLRGGKIRRFTARELTDAEADGFADRQLADTGWAARAARESLMRLWPDDGTRPLKVETANGMIVAELRKRWGLNDILGADGEKTRADHRHHAVDALAAACASRAFVKRLADYYKAKDGGAKEPKLPKPWETIRQDAEAAVAGVTVSHRVRKKVSGQLHKETVYGDTGEDAKTKSGTYRVFVARKPVSALSKGEVEDIRDDAVRRIVAEHVAARGGEPKKAFPPYPKVSSSGPEIRKVRLRTKQQLDLMAPLHKAGVPAPHGYADASARNHHIAVYRLADGKLDYDVVNLMEVARRLRRRQPVVKKDRGNGSAFIMSLASGDAIQFASGEREGLWIVEGAWSNGQVVLNRHDDATGDSVFRPNPGTIIKSGGEKVSVDPIGRIRPARD